MNAEDVLSLARNNALKIATAESCTGGLIAAALTEIAGSSDVFDRGFVTYSNDAKTDALGVSPDSIETHGAVSEVVAREMAAGALLRSEADLAVSVTGIAGPGGSEFKPEGRVCFGLASADQIFTQTIEFGAIGRGEVRKATVDHALVLLARAIVADQP
ncbi:MAG: CinA family protein [Pseudomonadota bacterium]